MIPLTSKVKQLMFIIRSDQTFIFYPKHQHPDVEWMWIDL